MTTAGPWLAQIAFGFFFGVGFTVASWGVGLVLAAVRFPRRQEPPPRG